MADFNSVDINKAARSLLNKRSRGSDSQSLAVEGESFIKQGKNESDAAFKARKKAFLIAARKRKQEMQESSRSMELK